MTKVIVGMFVGAAVVPVYWIFFTFARTLISKEIWKQEPLLFLLGLGFFSFIPFSAIQIVNESSLLGYLIGLLLSGLWFYRISKE